MILKLFFYSFFFLPGILSESVVEPRHGICLCLPFGATNAQLSLRIRKVRSALDCSVSKKRSFAEFIVRLCSLLA